VLLAKVGADGAVTTGPAAFVTVSVVVVLTAEVVTMIVMVFEPSTKFTDLPLPDEVDVPFTVIVALPLEAVGVTVIVESLDEAFDEYVKVPAENVGLKVPTETARLESRVSGTTPVAVPLAVVEPTLLVLVTVTLT